MTDLSSRAQAVWDAFDQDAQEIEAVAAVLRAAADQVVPLTKTPWGTTLFPVLPALEIRDRLLAIAAELEAAND